MNFRYEIKKLELKYPFKISRRTADHFREIIVVQIDDGFGSASPSRFYGETVETAIIAIEKIFSILNEIGDLDQMRFIMDKIESEIGGNYAAKSAIDLALHDRFAKKLNIPLHKMWGLNSKSTPQTAFTIGIDSIDVIREKVISAEQFAILKVKLGTENDLEILETIRSVTDKPIIVDANTAWTPKEAIRKIRQMRDLNVLLIEQPTHADDLDGLRLVRENSEIPIFADESVKRSADIPKLIGVVDGINIKLAKCGGLIEALKMINIAKIHHHKIMIGCMIESSLSIAAAVHLTPLVDVVDLDGHLLIRDDLFNGLIIENGKLKVPDRPGIGVKSISD